MEKAAFFLTARVIRAHLVLPASGAGALREEATITLYTTSVVTPGQLHIPTEGLDLRRPPRSAVASAPPRSPTTRATNPLDGV